MGRRRPTHGKPVDFPFFNSIASMVASGLTGILPWPRRPRERVSISYPVDEPVRLRLEAYSSIVRVRGVPSNRLRVKGGAGGKNKVWVQLGGKRDSQIMIVHVEDANVTVEAPISALGIVAEASQVRVEHDSPPLEYLSIRSESSRVKARLTLEPGGGVYANLDSSTARIIVEPAGEAPRWLEAILGSSILYLTVDGGGRYEFVEKRLEDSMLKLRRSGRVLFRVWLRAESSIVVLG